MLIKKKRETFVKMPITQKKFAKISHEYWTSYFAWLSAQHRQGNIQLNGTKILYPNLIVCTTFPGHYTVELFGCKPTFSQLRLVLKKGTSFNQYISQFTDTSTEPLIIAGKYNCITDIRIAHKSDISQAIKRFPHLKHGKPLIVGGDREGTGSLLGFEDKSRSISFSQCDFINFDRGIVRCKHVQQLLAFKNTINANYLLKFLRYVTTNKRIQGISTPPDNPTAIAQTIGSQLQGLYLTPSIHETTIGAFLNEHPEIIKKVFHTDHFIYEAYLEWIEHDGSIEDAAINPDLLIKRDDGSYDIYDLKTAALTKRNLTKGRTKRKRFIDYVNEGIAQLSHYREYFEYPKNAKHAYEKYKITVKDPSLVLVVGSWDNANSEEIDKASRMIDNITIIDYDTFVHRFLAAQPSTFNCA